MAVGPTGKPATLKQIPFEVLPHRGKDHARRENTVVISLDLLEELRQRWRDWQRREVDPGVAADRPSSLTRT